MCPVCAFQNALGRGLINSQSNAAAGGRRMSAIGGIADIRGFWLAMVCPLMTLNVILLRNFGATRQVRRA